MKEVNALLEKHELRNTSCRRSMLELFVQKEEALSVSELNSILGKEYDRATVYRTIQSFLDNGIIHKVLDTKEGQKYAMCHECDHETHSDEHIHFLCLKCGKSICLEEEIPNVPIPKGYRLQTSNMLLEGICPDCQ